jgi:hypothetical protein
MFFRIVGAAVRALIVAIIIIIPSAIVSSGASQAQMFTFTFAMMASAVVFVEYLVEVPAVLEFRFATPYNRLRILLTASMALVLSQGLINQFLSGSTGVMSVIAIFIENLMVNWPSPAKLVCEAFGLSEDLISATVMRLAAFASMMGLFFALIFGAFIWLGAWPLSKRGFNLWPNMPSFTARAGQKASTKIVQIAILSLTLAITLPYIIPYFVSYGGTVLGINYDDNLLMIYWVLLAWSVIPAMALFRAISLMKLAFLAENIRNF